MIIFPKKLHWNMIFLVSSGKMIFLFPENMILFFRRKMKDDLSQKKIHGNMIYSSNVPKKLHWNMIFLISWGEMAFLFPENMIFFCTNAKWKMTYLKKYMEVFFFSLQIWNYPSVKKEKMIFSPKNTPKDGISGISEKDDIHRRKNDIGILCTFMETFLSVFIYCFPMEKYQET